MHLAKSVQIPFPAIRKPTSRVVEFYVELRGTDDPENDQDQERDVFSFGEATHTICTCRPVLQPKQTLDVYDKETSLARCRGVESTSVGTLMTLEVTEENGFCIHHIIQVSSLLHMSSLRKK